MIIKADKTGLSAMRFGSVKAEEITKEANKELPDHASIRRTALIIRNENHIPILMGLFNLFLIVALPYN